MRILPALPLLLLLGACNVTKDNANNTIAVTVNEEEAANSASNASNTIENIAKDVGNEVKNTGEKVQNKVANTDVDLKVGTDVKTKNTH